MLQHSHRGIYEFLWSEHKYSVLGVSVKAQQNQSSRLGRNPQILSFLQRLHELCHSPQPEYYNGLLHAYLHIKGVLSRQRRFELIETLLNDQQAATLMIYKEVLTHSEKSLYGCRLFFPCQAIYKYWDSQDKPGLWLCFGSFQLHLLPHEVFARVAAASQLTPAALKERLLALQSGLQISDFNNWPAALQKALLLNQMVATPGNEAYLHSRINLEHFDCQLGDERDDLYTTAAKALEMVWDNASLNDPLVGSLPEYDEFMNAFKAITENTTADFSIDEGWQFIATLYREQECRENGIAIESELSQLLRAGIGVETADEEIDSEEGEHGDDEADY